MTQDLTGKIVEIAQVRRRFGYRRIHDLLRPEFPGVNHKHVCRLYSQPNLALMPSQMAISMPAPMVPLQSFVPVQALRPGRYWRAGCRWRSGWPRRSASLRTCRGAPAPDCERGRQPLFAGAHQPGDLTPTIGGDRQGTIGTRRTFVSQETALRPGWIVLAGMGGCMTRSLKSPSLAP